MFAKLLLWWYCRIRRIGVFYFLLRYFFDVVVERAWWRLQQWCRSGGKCWCLGLGAWCS